MLKRLNRAIAEKACCLLFDLRLDKSLWAEACNAAVYLRNRKTAVGLNRQTPREIRYGRKSDVSNLHICSSEGMTLIPKEKRCKFDNSHIGGAIIFWGE